MKTLFRQSRARTILVLSALVLLAVGTAYAATYSWKCTLCKEVRQTTTAAAPSSSGCSKASNGNHNWIRQF